MEIPHHGRDHQSSPHVLTPKSSHHCSNAPEFAIPIVWSLCAVLPVSNNILEHPALMPILKSLIHSLNDLVISEDLFL